MTVLDATSLAHPGICGKRRVAPRGLLWYYPADGNDTTSR